MENDRKRFLHFSQKSKRSYCNSKSPFMKYFIPQLLILGSVVACNNKPMDHFVIRGNIPGAMDSTEITLAPNGKFDDRIEGYVINGKFELQGKMNTPTHCRLSIDNQDIIVKKGLRNENLTKYVEIDFFVENGELTFQTPHIDSLPESFWRYDIRKEKNYTLKGSTAQDIFFQYQQQTIPLRHEIRTLDRAYSENGRIEDFKTLQEQRGKLENLTKAFIKENRNLAVNLHLAEQLKKEPFTYDQAYLDELAGLFVSYQDTCSELRNFHQYLQQARAYVQGKALQEGEIITPDGKKTSLLSQLKKDRYTVIDFWASWCGPCRASFPHLREMYNAYGEKVTFISLSVDKDEKEWQKALGEEKLPWNQYLATPELSKSTRTEYDLTSIPTFLVIDPEGKIIFSGHSSGELETMLETKCNI